MNKTELIKELLIRKENLAGNEFAREVIQGLTIAIDLVKQLADPADKEPCEWCKQRELQVRSELPDGQVLLGANFCPACGRRLGGGK
jgi:hypothetical protein